MALPELDISKSIVNKEGKPTQYFEELWFLLTQELITLQSQIDDLQSQIDGFHP